MSEPWKRDILRRPPALYASSRTGWSSHSRVLAGHTVVELRGEIDLDADAELRLYLDGMTCRPFARVVVDLRPVTFIDCVGLSLLVRAHRRVRERAGRLLLVGSDPLLLRILHITGLDRPLPAHPTLDRALAAGEAPPPAVEDLLAAAEEEGPLASRAHEEASQDPNR
ncbi:STAS domain-containing protein [Streptomyces spectabilis]|uniref:Anti-sigma factor antagonist n=1 Tax=Streptomyces spectabilis TaxID=68270 RepID=A0A516R1V3_STRST|nr:STAS domain-containing protein [Streptomyces spectabilis]QDQ09634.1 STAS domain-containing protein [Streptomyces spectabilis]